MRHDALVVIGNFDGVHRGHQALFAAVARRSREDALAPKLLTFDPHPAVVLGRPAPAMLTTTARKIELIERGCAGIEVVVQAFDATFARQSPDAFVDEVLARRLCAGLVVVGGNFRFGAGRAGGIDELRDLGSKHGFQIVVEPLASDAGGVWSSTRIRACIAAGEVQEAASMLGRPHMLSGHVIRGEQRGQQLGFPTCNIANAPEAMPAHGVYAVLVDRVEGGVARALARGVANVGVRPTVASDGRPLLEAHLFDVDIDLYDAELRVHLLARLRGERRFEDVAALREQIAKDCEHAHQQVDAAQPLAEAKGAWV